VLEIVAADTVALDVPVDWGSIRVLLLRAPVSRLLVAPSTYVLSSINGHPLTDTLPSEDPTRPSPTTQILCDSLVFLDDVFYRRHGSARRVTHLESGDSVVNVFEWSIRGLYTADGNSTDRLRVSEYLGGAYFGVGDGFLNIDGQALLRHTGVTSPYYKFRMFVQQYDRRQ